MAVDVVSVADDDDFGAGPSTPTNGVVKPLAGAKYVESVLIDEERAAATRVPFRSLPQLVEPMLQRAATPFLGLRFSPDDEPIVEAPHDAIVGLSGPTGVFKTTTAVQLGVTFARSQGITVYLSLELGNVEVAARAAGQALGLPWRAPLTGQVPRADLTRALDVSRFVVLDGDNANLGKLEETITTMRKAFPGLPVLVVIDYLGLLRGAGEVRDERLRIATLVEQVRSFVVRLGVLALLLMQMSRQNARASRAGELLGADTTATGAESGAIEHACAVTLSLGAIETRDDGRVSIALSVGKNRYGIGDRVWPLIVEPASGVVTIDGTAKPASIVRTERASKVDDTKVNGAKLAITEALRKSAEPMSRSKLRDAIGGKDTTIAAAVMSLVKADDGSPDAVVEVRFGRHGKAWPVWLRSKAIEARLDIGPSMGAGRGLDD
jgi:hypothetical protein